MGVASRVGVAEVWVEPSKPPLAIIIYSAGAGAGALVGLKHRVPGGNSAVHAHTLVKIYVHESRAFVKLRRLDVRLKGRIACKIGVVKVFQGIGVVGQL